MESEQKRTLIIIALIILIVMAVSTCTFLLNSMGESDTQQKQMVTEIPETMLTFWNLNDSRDMYILEGQVLNSSVNPAKKIHELPLHTITIADEAGNAHTVWMIFDMEPNTYFRRYHNPIIYDYYVQFVVEEIDDAEQQIYRCFYYRQIWGRTT